MTLRSEVDEAVLLREAVDELTLPTFTKVGQDVGGRERVTRVEHAPLLRQLDDAIRGVMSATAGGASSSASTRSLVNGDAFHQFMMISNQIREWCRLVGVEPRRDPVEGLRAWHAKVLAQEIDRRWYTGQLRRWAGAIRGVVEPRRPIENTSPCPVCLNTEWTTDKDNGGVFPIHVTYAPYSPQLLSTVRATCRACGASWEGEQGSRALRYEQDTLDGVLQAEHGVWDPEAKRYADGTTLRDAAAILRRRRFPVCPEHAAGKPQNCTGWALNEDDEMVPCTAAEGSPS